MATYFFKNNTLDSTVNKDGFQIDYKTNKRVVNAKGLFFNNLEQGEWIENNDEGILERIVHYKEFYKSGKLKTFGNLWNGKKQDTLSWFYENGELESQEITELDTISGQSTGFVYWFYESGKLHKRIPLINEKQNGLVEIFYESGEFKAKTEYTDGLMNGNGIGYYESGVISYKGKVIKNNIHGDFKYYNEYGELIKIENYNNGQLLDSIVY